MKNQNIAFGLIDAQCGFMPNPAKTTARPDGFGELAVADGEQIIPVTNKLLASFALQDTALIFTTQDWHPKHTAHFADEPNYTSNWPVHCVAGTPGADIHPDINLPTNVSKFYKGYEQLISGEDDTSYSGFNSLSFDNDQSLPDILTAREVKTLYLGGLALDYCVGLTALDFAAQSNMNVVVISDATKPVAQESGDAMLQKIKAAGIHVTTSAEVLATLAESEK